MTTVLIVYTTSLGNTQQLAKAIADGALSVAGTDVQLKEAHDATKDDVRSCDALIVGSPMRNLGRVAQGDGIGSSSSSPKPI